MRIGLFLHAAFINQSQRSHLYFITQSGIIALIVQTMISLPASYLCNYGGWDARKKANRKQASHFFY